MQSGIYSYPRTSRIAYGTDFTEALSREFALVGGGAPKGAPPPLNACYPKLTSSLEP